MSHMPVDHPLRGLYRGLTVLTGVVAVGYGAIALAKTSDHSFFGDTSEKVLGMQANAGAGLLWVVIGAIAIVTALVGRNLDAKVNYYFGPVLWILGTIGLFFIRNGTNFLAFSITSVCALYVVGTILLTSALYSTVSGGASVRRPNTGQSETSREPVSAGH
jgi:Na+/melibiose symporter-like transporter